MLTKHVDRRATTATSAGCVWRELGNYTPSSRCGSIPAAEGDPRPSILKLNTEGSPQVRSAISSSEHTITRHSSWSCKRPNTLPQTIDSQFLASWVSPEQKARPFHVYSRAVGMDNGRSVFRATETEWLCADVPGYKIPKLHIPQNSTLTTHINSHPDEG